MQLTVSVANNLGVFHFYWNTKGTDLSIKARIGMYESSSSSKEITACSYLASEL